MGRSWPREPDWRQLSSTVVDLTGRFLLDCGRYQGTLVQMAIWQLVLRILGFVETFALFGLAWIGYALDLSESGDDPPTLFDIFLSNSKAHAPEVVVCLALAVLFSRIIRWFGRGKSDEAKIIDEIVEREIEKLRAACYEPKLPVGEAPDNNRLTLFERVPIHWSWSPLGYLRCRRWVWPWSGWLIARYRSGHTTQNSPTKFLAPNDADAEGIAGETWRKNSAYRVRNLPNLSGMPRRGLTKRSLCWLLSRLPTYPEFVRSYLDDRKLVREYAESTHVSEASVWVRIERRRKCPVSMCGIPIEDSKAKIWGVLVIDNSNEFENVDTDDGKFRRGLREFVKQLHSFQIIP